MNTGSCEESAIEDLDDSGMQIDSSPEDVSQEEGAQESDTQETGTQENVSQESSTTQKVNFIVRQKS